MAASPQDRQNLGRISFGENTLKVQTTHGVGLAKVELTVEGWGVGGGEEGGRLHGATGGSCVTVWCTGNWVSLFTCPCPRSVEIVSGFFVLHFVIVCFVLFIALCVLIEFLCSFLSFYAHLRLFRFLHFFWVYFAYFFSHKFLIFSVNIEVRNTVRSFKEWDGWSILVVGWLSESSIFVIVEPRVTRWYSLLLRKYFIPVSMDLSSRNYHIRHLSDIMSSCD